MRAPGLSDRRRARSAIAAGLAALALLALGGCGGSGHRSGAVAVGGAVPSLGSLALSGAGHRFYEIYQPAGAPRGTILLIHGGGWSNRPGDARREMATAALALLEQGWRVVNVDYTSGLMASGVRPDPVPMLRDVVAFYDQIRRAFGGPVCAYGQSAGAHLAAMLAVERPSLRCAVLDAPPLDLPTLMRETDAAGRTLIRNTFGTDRSVLARWSPARDWRANGGRTAVWATFAAGDPVVPPRQGSTFSAVDPSANVDVVPVGSFFWLHSSIDYGAYYERVLKLFRWLEQTVPADPHAAASQGTDLGAACDRLPPPGERFRLMLAGDAWQQLETPGQQMIAATRGCSGSGGSQDDGLSLWALPSTDGAVLPDGDQAALVLQPGRVIRRLSVSLRGFLARPRDWVLGLYASGATSGPISTPVAVCSRGSCSGLGLIRTRVGSLLVPAGSRANPDLSDQPPSASFPLPAGTRRVAWVLRCAAPSGCSLKGIADATGVSARPRDPVGHPAVLSIYSVNVS